MMACLVRANFDYMKAQRLLSELDAQEYAQMPNDPTQTTPIAHRPRSFIPASLSSKRWEARGWDQWELSAAWVAMRRSIMLAWSSISRSAPSSLTCGSVMARILREHSALS